MWGGASVAHTPSVQEDLGSILHPSPGWHFSEALISLRVGVNCSKFDCSTIICSTLLAANQLLDTKFINCSNPVNPGSTGFEQLTKKVTMVDTVKQLTLLSSATFKLKKSIFYL
jgi:hypothetical protein